MTQVSTSAAYVRKGEFAGQAGQQPEDIRSSILEEQVWALLETPQTVESLRRAAGQPDNGRMQADRNQIEKMLERLLDADLIELSPDS